MQIMWKMKYQSLFHLFEDRLMESHRKVGFQYLTNILHTAYHNF